MRKMNLKSWGLLCLLFAGFTLASCQQEILDTPSSQVSKDSGTVTLDLSALTAFDNKTKALDESQYNNYNNFKIQILSGASIKNEFLFKDRPATINLDAGSYMVKAFYGTEHVASRNEFYVYGEEAFGIIGGEVNKSIQIKCEPTCARVKVQFDPAMSTYFSDYKVEYNTKALNGAKTATWLKNDTEPWYLKVDEFGEDVSASIVLTPKADYATSEATVIRTQRLKPNEGWTLKVAPKYNQGQLGLTITIDKTTNDQTIDVIIPSNWK